MLLSDQSDDPTILTLENLVTKAKKASQTATSKITNINQWTTAFTIYLSKLSHQFRGRVRAQELLAYMSMIQDETQTHKGLGWCIYKFRCKAALNLTVNWLNIDQQLRLKIFTTSPDTLTRQYPIFFKWTA